MNSHITSRLRRPGRVLVALTLALAALVLLLSVWGGLPTANARESVTDKSGSQDLSSSSTALAAYTIFLPMLQKSDVVFADDFGSGSTWEEGTWGGCTWDLRDGRYRLTVKDRDEVCIMPNFNIPRQFDGTFKIRARRISDEDRKLVYGFIFDAGTDATEDDGTRWSLEIYPNDYAACNDKPFFWLVALDDGIPKFHNYNQAPDKHECTDDYIYTRDDVWNQLMVIRKGDGIKVYLNGQLMRNYQDVPELTSNDQNKLGYFLLRAVSLSDEDVIIEYDDLEILRSTTAP